MANFCPNCGSSVNPNVMFCPVCGTALSGVSNTQYNNNQNYNYGYQHPVDNTSSTIGTVLGTLVAVNLIGGLTRQLYYYGGRYYYDPYCRCPFMDMHRIMGRPRPMLRPMFGRPPMGPPPMHRPPMGGHRPPMGRPPMGGPRPPMGGPRGGGPGGRR